MKISKTLAAGVIALSLSGCGADSESHLLTGKVLGDSGKNLTLHVVENFENTIFDKDIFVEATQLLRNISGGLVITPIYNENDYLISNKRPYEIEQLKQVRSFIEHIDVSDETKDKYFSYIDHFIDLYEKNTAYEAGLTQEYVQSLVYKNYPELKEMVELRESLWGETRYKESRELEKRLRLAMKEQDAALEQVVKEFYKINWEIHSTFYEAMQLKFEAANSLLDGERLASTLDTLVLNGSKQLYAYQNSDGSCPNIDIKDYDGNVIKSLPSYKHLYEEDCYSYSNVRNVVEVDQFLTTDVYNKVFDLEKDWVAASIKYKESVDQTDNLLTEFYKGSDKLKRENPTSKETRKMLRSINYAAKEREFYNNVDVMDFYDSSVNEFNLPIHGRDVEAYRLVKSMDGVLEELSFNPEKYFAEHPEHKDLFTMTGIYKLLDENAKRIFASATKIEVNDDNGTRLKEGEYHNIPKILEVPTDKGFSEYYVVDNVTKSRNGGLYMLVSDEMTFLESIAKAASRYNAFPDKTGTINNLFDFEAHLTY